MPRSAVSATLALVVAGLAAGGLEGAGARSPEAPILAADLQGRLLLLDRSGTIQRRIPAPPLGSNGRVQGLDASSDRKQAFVAVYHGSPATDSLFRVSLATGSASWIARGLSPAVSPDGRRLAYVRTELRNDIEYRDVLVIRTLPEGRERCIPFASHTPVGTPPELILNWSPDGRRIVLFGAHRVRVVDVGHTRRVENGAGIPGLLAPVFLDAHTVVGLANCCIGRQRLVAVHLETGKRSAFATLSAPPEALRALPRGRLLVTNALHQLQVVSRARIRGLRGGIAAASD